MRAFVGFIMRGRWQAALVVTAAAVMSLLVPPLIYVSGAALALVVLRHGAPEGAVVMAASVAAVAGLGMIAAGSPMLGVAYLVVLWLPLFVLASILRSTVSLPITLSIAFWGGVAVLFAVHATLGDVAQRWREWQDSVLRPAMEQSGMQVSAAELDRLMDLAAPMMSGVLVALLILSVVGSLLAARWWQALLYNPGGFQREFHALRLGRAAAIGLMIIGVLALLGGGMLAETAVDALPVLMTGFLVPGLALAHGIAAYRRAHIAWLIGMYILLLALLPHVMYVLLVTAAFMDTWFNFRGRIGAGEH